MGLLGLLEGAFHRDSVGLDLGDGFFMDDKLALLDSFKEMEELRVLETRIWIVHHDTEHGL